MELWLRSTWPHRMVMAGPMQMWAADTVHNWAAYLTAPTVLFLLYLLMSSKVR